VETNHTDQITYAGYHPNDTAFNWLGGIPYLSSPTIAEFFNNFTGQNQAIIHGVNRLELLGRNSAGTFLLQVLERVDGKHGPWVLTEVHRTDRVTQQSSWKRTITPFLVTGDPLQDTRAWLEAGYEALRLLDQEMGTAFALLAGGDRYFDDYEATFPTSPPEYADAGQAVEVFVSETTEPEPLSDEPQFLSDFGGYTSESTN